MKPTTAWGKKLLEGSWWNEGMRGHFTRISNTTSPQDMEYAICAIEQEARSSVITLVEAALTDENELAHGEAVYERGGPGLGMCAYCDEDWPCSTQQTVDRLLANLKEVINVRS